MIHYKGIVIHTQKEVEEPSPETFQLLEKLDLNRRDEVLEIGTGTGLVTIYCAQRSRRVVATDSNPQAIKLALKNLIANKTYNTELKEGSLLEVVDGQKFDLIVLNFLSDGLKKFKDSEDSTNLILELKNYLSKDGRVQILHPHSQLDKTISQLEESGFKVDLCSLEGETRAVVLKGTLK